MRLPQPGLLGQSIARDTPCTAAELRRLWRCFQAKDIDLKGFLTHKEFLTFSGISYNPFGARLADLFCNEDGFFKFRDIVDLFSAFHRCTPFKMRTAWAFAIWDLDGDDKLSAQDLKIGLDMLANGGSDVQEIETEMPDIGNLPAMFDDSVPVGLGRRQSIVADLLSNRETGQVLQRIAAEIEPVGSVISYEEFEGVISQLPEFLANFYLTV